MKTYGGVEVSFLTQELDSGVMSALRVGRFTTENTYELLTYMYLCLGNA
jgi:hypothetical protein